MARHGFAFSLLTRAALAPLGVTPATAHVDVDEERIVVRFGPWRLETTTANVVEVTTFDVLNPIRALGVRLSMADRGVTFGSSRHGGVCLRLREPVPGALPFGLLRHPGVTVTVADPDAFAADVRERMAS